MQFQGIRERVCRVWTVGGIAYRDFSHLSLSWAGLGQLGKVWIWIFPPDWLLCRMVANGKISKFLKSINAFNNGNGKCFQWRGNCSNNWWAAVTNVLCMLTIVLSTLAFLQCIFKHMVLFGKKLDFWEWGVQKCPICSRVIEHEPPTLYWDNRWDFRINFHY